MLRFEVRIKLKGMLKGKLYRNKFYIIINYFCDKISKICRELLRLRKVKGGKIKFLKLVILVLYLKLYILNNNIIL